MSSVPARTPNKEAGHHREEERTCPPCRRTGRGISTVVAATPGSTTADTKTTYCYDNRDRINRIFSTATSSSPGCTTTATVDSWDTASTCGRGSENLTYCYDPNGNLTVRRD